MRLTEFRDAKLFENTYGRTGQGGGVLRRRVFERSYDLEDENPDLRKVQPQSFTKRYRTHVG